MPVKTIKFNSLDTLDVKDFLESDDWKSRSLDQFDNNPKHNRVSVFSFNNLDLELDNKSSLELHIPGHVYIMDVNQSFFHSMFDNLGQYLAIKKYFPEVKPLSMVGDFPYKNDDYLNSNYKKHILDLCGISVDDIVHYPMYGRITFEKVSFISKSSNNILYGILEAAAKLNQELPMDIHWSETTKQIYVIGRALKDFMLYQTMPLSGKRSDKIFLSRKSRSSVFEKNHNLIAHLKENGVTWELDDTKKMSDPNGITKTNLDKFLPATPTDNLLEAQYRYMPIDEETLIENYFMHLGYAVVDVETMPLPEQIAMFAKCTHIATITGAGSLNSIYLPNGGTFILLANNTGYKFYHEDLLTVTMNDPIIVFDKRKVSGIFSAREMLEDLEKNYSDRL